MRARMNGPRRNPDRAHIARVTVDFPAPATPVTSTRRPSETVREPRLKRGTLPSIVSLLSIGHVSCRAEDTCRRRRGHLMKCVGGLRS